MGLVDILYRLLRGKKLPDEPSLDTHHDWDEIVNRHEQFQVELMKAQQKTAVAVWQWAVGTVSDRERRPLPAHLPHSIPLRKWMLGLDVKELFALAQSDAWSVWHHIYSPSAHTIHGVPAVSDLEPCSLKWPRPPSPSKDAFHKGSSGGIRPKGEKSLFSSLRPK